MTVAPLSFCAMRFALLMAALGFDFYAFLEIGEELDQVAQLALGQHFVEAFGHGGEAFAP